VNRVGLLVVLMSVTVMGKSGDPVVLQPIVETSPLWNYEGAPATPDADDPAIWVNRRSPGKSLVIGTAKDAGLLVYDLSGRLVQALLPTFAPQILEADPPTPGGLNAAPDNPCPESDSGETFGRYNNVEVAYDLPLGVSPDAARADVAVVSDRGCDRVRFFRIDPDQPSGPLVDITAADVPRVFAQRYDQPSLLQPMPGTVEGWTDNPLDDQNTVYGLTVDQARPRTVFVTSRERGLVRQLTIEPTPHGTLSYETERTLLFDTSFELADGNGTPYQWTPCREAAAEEPQSEGLVFDSLNDTLYVAFETVGLYRLPLPRSAPKAITVGVDQLIEPVRTFGRAYHAIPDDDEFECEYDPDRVPEPGDVVAPGSDANAGSFLEADLEGLSIVRSTPGQVVMLASSQGDSSFHFYRIKQAAQHLGSFFVEGVGDTDGVHYAPAPMGRNFPSGLLVVQNGEAPEPPDTGPVAGYEFDGSTQFLLLNFAEALKALGN
jgi:3-phytase